MPCGSSQSPGPRIFGSTPRWPADNSSQLSAQSMATRICPAKQQDPHGHSLACAVWGQEKPKAAGEANPAPPESLLSISPDKFRTDLTNARIAGTRNVTEGAAANVSGRVVKLCVVEDVEEFTSNLEVHRFIEWNHLRHAQIGVVESRAVKESSVRCPESSAVSAWGGPGEIAVSRDECVIVKIFKRAGRFARVVDVNPSRDIRHIGGGTASKRAV